MKEKKETGLDRISKRAPMTVNADGEVVFAGLPEGKRMCAKPTPLMLCNEIAKMFGNAMRRSTADQHIRGSYRDLLFHLAREDGRTQLELANLTHLKPPSVSVALAKLEDEGYITRQADPVDQRKCRVYLTEKGRSVDVKAHEVIGTLERRAMADFTPEEQKQLTVLLYRLRENIADEKE